MSAHPFVGRVSRVVMLCAPLALAILEIWHPNAHVEHFYQDTLPRAQWWRTLHLIQLPLFGLAALTVYMLTSGLDGVAVRLSRVGLFIFVIFYTSLDAIIGIAVGVLTINAQQFTAEQQEVLARAINMLAVDPFVGGTFPSLFPVLGTLGWLLGGLGAALALYKEGVSRPAILFLVLSSLLLLAGHARPFGPLAFGCLFLANLLLLGENKLRHAAKRSAV